jgi:hypothetical protein
MCGSVISLLAFKLIERHVVAALSFNAGTIHRDFSRQCFGGE